MMTRIGSFLKAEMAKAVQKIRNGESRKQK
jgi:hypothetical protein